MQKAAQSQVVQGVRYNGLAPAPRLELKLDRAQAQSMGLAIDDVYNAIQLMLAPVYVNDFYFQGRVLRVQMQADAPFRMNEDALQRFYLPANAAAEQCLRAEWRDHQRRHGAAGLGGAVRSGWSRRRRMQRFNGFAAMQIVGANAAGHSSGQAMGEMQTHRRAGSAARLRLRLGRPVAAGNPRRAPRRRCCSALSILVVFLCLAALYESWATPIAVLLIVPVGIIGAIVRRVEHGPVQRRVLQDRPDHHHRPGGQERHPDRGVRARWPSSGACALYDAVMEAARLRLRPILMTSFAFILGVLPLVFSSGAGANARRAIGTGVAGGMLSAAILGVMLAPVFYVTIRRMVGDKLETEPELNRSLNANRVH